MNNINNETGGYSTRKAYIEQIQIVIDSLFNGDLKFLRKLKTEWLLQVRKELVTQIKFIDLVLKERVK